jgi:hypothetical protein
MGPLFDLAGEIFARCMLFVSVNPANFLFTRQSTCYHRGKVTANMDRPLRQAQCVLYKASGTSSFTLTREII